MIWLLAGLAQADTLAVLPLEQASASEEFAGLGKGLAGMMTSDLHHVDSIDLVERDRIQAVLDELALAETGFLDEETAGKLGKGIGADALLVGSYSVVAGTIAIDARIVDADSGEVRSAADSSGPVEDWVAVQKDVVAVLVAQVEISASARRKMMVDTPTESFEALTSWSEGLDAEDEGRLDEARAAYAQALSIDPAFSAAQSQLADLRSLVEGTLSERERKKLEQADANTRLVLDSIPTVTGDVHDVRVQGDFLVRLDALYDAGLSCQRAAEMTDWLNRSDWELTRDPSAGMAVEYAAGIRRTELAGDTLTEMDRWEIQTFVVDNPLPWSDDGRSLADAIQACSDDPVRDLDGLAAQVRKAGVGDLATHSMTVDDRIQVQAAIALARDGASPALTERVEALLERHPDDPVARTRIESYSKDILRVAADVEKHRLARLHVDPDDLVRIERAVLEGDTSVVHTDTSYCAYAVQQEQARAASWFARYDSYSGDDTGREHMISELGFSYGPLREFGCIVGFAGWAPMMMYTNLVRNGCVEMVQW
ncbi:MAG: hypothetical protein GY913_32465 [Proteobacteria bacterium]|nr:hypothetical protein [Pseudomonadota bacterium]MCP4921636.1 hypothetical protein [Pseudomonadota bacterium]